MKITKQDLEAMRADIAPLDTERVRDLYRTGQFPRSDRTQDVDKRYRWDLAHAARVDICALYDAGLNDTHIDTALRSIVRPL